MCLWLKRAGEAVHLVSVGYTLLCGVALVIEVLAPRALSTSNTMQAWILAGAIVGALCGYFRTAFAWAGKGRPQCLAAGKRYLVLCGVSYLVLVVAPMVILKPSMAEKYRWVRAFREFLLNSTPLANCVEFFGAALAAFFLVGSIVQCSPNLANPRRGVYE